MNAKENAKTKNRLSTRNRLSAKASFHSIEKVGRVTSASVKKCTGKDWDEWIALLDRVGARIWSHQELVAHLKKKYRLSMWWQQGVAVGYETAIGRLKGRPDL